MGAPADEPDDPPSTPQDVASPGVRRDREGTVEDDRADVLGVAGGVHRHQEGPVGIAPEIEAVEAERRPDGVDVVGDGGGTVEPRVGPEIGAAEFADLGLVEGKWVLAPEAGAAQRPRAPGAARIDQQEIATA